MNAVITNYSTDVSKSVKSPSSSDDQQVKIICPVIRGAVHEQHLHVDDSGKTSISNLKRVMESFGMLRQLAYVAVFANRVVDIFPNLFFSKFYPQKMREGLIKHSCDSGILSTGIYSEEKLKALAGYAHNGIFTKAGFDRAVQNRKEEQKGTWIGAALSRLEFSIILSTFGSIDDNGNKIITIEAVQKLYQ